MPPPHPQEINEADGIASVHEAFRLGINFFDTSPFYGSTRSEAVREREQGGPPIAGCTQSPVAGHCADVAVAVLLSCRCWARR
jgi:hypothetical protein